MKHPRVVQGRVHRLPSHPFPHGAGPPDGLSRIRKQDQVVVGLHDEFVTQLEIRGRSRGAVGVGARLEGDDLFALGVVSVDLTFFGFDSRG